jgi:hypothetical protein
MNFTKTVLFWGWLFILFLSFSPKATLVASFPTRLMLHFSTKLNKIFTQTMTWHITTPQRGLLWPIDTTMIVAPLQSCQPDQTFSTTNLIAHDSHFKLTIKFFSSQIKGQDLAPHETKCPSSTPYKEGWIS